MVQLLTSTGVNRWTSALWRAAEPAPDADRASIWFQRVSLTTGWYILAAATAVQTAGMLWRIVRRNKKNRP